MQQNKDVLIEICPVCNALHRYFLTEGVLDGIGKSQIQCGRQIALLPPEREGDKPVPVLCDYVIEPKESNTFTIRRWKFRERQQFYSLLGSLKDTNIGSVQNLMLTIQPKVMDWALTTTTVKSPSPLKTKEDLDKTELDGNILEALYGSILVWNSPPLIQSSSSQLPFTQQTPASFTMTP